MANIEPEDFIKVWMQALELHQGYPWIGEQFGGISRQYVEQYGRKLRIAGVNLPKLHGAYRTNFKTLDNVEIL